MQSNRTGTAITLTHSESSYWKEKEDRLQEHQEKYIQRIEVCRQEQTDVNLYYQIYLGCIKEYLENHANKYLRTLEAFYHSSFFDLTTVSKNFLNVLENLSKLKGLLPTDTKDFLYQPSQDIFVNLLRLTHQVASAKLDNDISSQFDKQLAALNDTIMVTKRVLSKPPQLEEVEDACYELAYSSIELHKQIETRSARFRRTMFEKPYLHSFLCAASLLIGASLFAAAIVFHPVLLAGSPAVLLLGLFIFGVGLKLLRMKSDVKKVECVNERARASTSINISSAVLSLTSDPAILKGPEKKEEEEYSDEEEQQTEEAFQL